jgi:hypothetical protein
MAVQTSVLNLGTPLDASGTWRSRTLSIILVVAIAAVFWVDSPYPALLKRYPAGTQVKPVGALTFGTVYPVDRSMPVLAARFASPALNLVVLAMTFALFPLPIALLKLATVLFLILVFIPFISARQGESEPPFNFAVEIPSSETWGQALANATRSYLRSFWTVFRVAFPLMILAAVLGAFAVELLPQQALSGSVTVIAIIAVALVSAFMPVPMAFDVAIAYILMAKVCLFRMSP